MRWLIPLLSAFTIIVITKPLAVSNYSTDTLAEEYGMQWDEGRNWKEGQVHHLGVNIPSKRQHQAYWTAKGEAEWALHDNNVQGLSD
ncbi:hypothetical protein EV426DRAFT_700466 [Tirmania nivea]|nr:hypothetical protein EV426DRAFT_700466 [Tirmania nivea]